MGTREALQTQLYQKFSAFMPNTSIAVDTETQIAFECDGLAMYREMPLITVLPDCIDQVQAVMRICHSMEIPVVARGGGTGLSAGAMPNSEGVLLSMAKFNNILEIDPTARQATVQPGVRNLAISEAAASYGLYYAPDPSSQIACTIGGNIAENAGGVHCLKYGVTVNNVLSVDIVDVSGELIRIGNQGLDSNGADLLALITGSEGMLGVVVCATLKLLPIAEKMQLVMAAFDDLNNASDAVGAVIAAGIIPAGLEMMDHFAIVAAEQYLQIGYPIDAAALLLCEVDGSEAEVQAQISLVSKVFKDHGASTLRVSRSEQERQLLWKGRKNAFPAIGRLSPDYYCMDGTIPRTQLATVLTKMATLSKQYGLRVANVFHAGDGNLHPLILFDANNPGEFEKTEAFGADILALCIEVGGCITGEHGVGLEKIKQMQLQFSAAEITQFHALKAAFDPQAMLNPGKGIPMLKNCQEYRSIEKAPSPR